MPPLLFLGRWRERGAWGLLPRWQEVRGEVIRSEIFLAGHLCKYKNYACLWKNTICFAYFFFRRGAGGLLRRWQEVKGEIIRSEIFLADHLRKYKNYACLWINTNLFCIFLAPQVL